MGVYIKKEQIYTNDGELVDSRVKRFYTPFKEDVGYNFKYKSCFVKGYLEIELPKCFTDSDIGKLYRLSRKIYSSSNLLAKRSHGTIVPLSIKDVARIVGVHRTNFNPFWDKVLECNVVKVVEVNGESFFCFNPLYFNTTRYLPLYVYQAFRNELCRHLPAWVIKKYAEMEVCMSRSTEEKELESGAE